MGILKPHSSDSADLRAEEIHLENNSSNHSAIIQIPPYSSTRLSPSAIIALVLGGTLVVLLAMALAVVYVARRKHLRDNDGQVFSEERPFGLFRYKAGSNSNERVCILNTGRRKRIAFPLELELQVSQKGSLTRSPYTKRKENDWSDQPFISLPSSKSSPTVAEFSEDMLFVREENKVYPDSSFGKSFSATASPRQSVNRWRTSNSNDTHTGSNPRTSVIQRPTDITHQYLQSNSTAELLPSPLTHPRPPPKPYLRQSPSNIVLVGGGNASERHRSRLTRLLGGRNSAKFVSKVPAVAAGTNDSSYALHGAESETLYQHPVLTTSSFTIPMTGSPAISPTSAPTQPRSICKKPKSEPKRSSSWHPNALFTLNRQSKRESFTSDTSTNASILDVPWNSEVQRKARKAIADTDYSISPISTGDKIDRQGIEDSGSGDLGSRALSGSTWKQWDGNRI